MGRRGTEEIRRDVPPRVLIVEDYVAAAMRNGVILEQSCHVDGIAHVATNTNPVRQPKVVSVFKDATTYMQSDHC